MADCEIIINIVDKSPTYLVNIVDPCGEVVPTEYSYPYAYPIEYGT